jgi:anaerobic magnesium-protoporphyrin IX monomethyl ester cyclase
VLERIAAGCDIDDVPGLALRTAEGYRVTPKRNLIRDPDTLPFPARDILMPKWRAGAIPTEIYIAGSRGCPYRCSFCDIKTFYKNGQGLSWRCRSPGNVVAELRQLCAEFGTSPTYCFVDDQFLGPGNRGRAHAHEFVDRLMESNLGVSFEITCRADSIDQDIFDRLKRAGLTGVYLGLDSGSQAALDRFQKDISVERNLHAIRTLRELDLAVDFGFIMFDPWTTTNDLEANLAFLRELVDMGVVLHPAVLLNGLKLYPNRPLPNERGATD